VSVAVDKQIDRALDFLRAIPGAAEAASARALNRAASAARDTAVTSICNRYAVQSSDIRQKVKTTVATKESLGVSVVARSGPLSLTYFPHSPGQPGTGGRGLPQLRAEILRGQPRTIRGAFVAPINGKPRIMIRSGGATSSGKRAIRSLSAVPMAVMLGAEEVRNAVEDRALAVFDERMEREIDSALGRTA